jgi:hypothetical protein
MMTRVDKSTYIDDSLAITPDTLESLEEIFSVLLCVKASKRHDCPCTAQHVKRVDNTC